MKSAVYSWRLSAETKAALEDEARRLGENLSQLLDRIAREWLEARRGAASGTEEEQLRLRAAASRAIGKIAGGKAQRAERARTILRQRLERRRAG